MIYSLIREDLTGLTLFARCLAHQIFMGSNHTSGSPITQSIFGVYLDPGPIACSIFGPPGPNKRGSNHRPTPETPTPTLIYLLVQKKFVLLWHVGEGPVPTALVNIVGISVTLHKMLVSGRPDPFLVVTTGNVADKYLLLNQNCKKKIIILILLYRGYAQMLVWIETMNAL